MIVSEIQACSSCGHPVKEKEGHSFEGNRRELRKHLRSEHPEIFDEVNLKC